MAAKEVEIKRICLFSGEEESCVKEVIDFLLNSECASLGSKERKSNNVEAITKYTYGDGAPTVNKENWLGNSRVHFVLKIFDPNQIRNDFFSTYKHGAVIVFSSDKADMEVILNLLRKCSYPKMRQFQGMTVIGKWSKRFSKSIEEPFQNLRTTKWSWNGKIAYNWSADSPETNNLWFHICRFSGKNGPTTVSYNSEPIFELKKNILHFFICLLKVIYYNICRLSSGTERNGILETLSREGSSYIRYTIPNIGILMQCNVSNLSEFNSLVQEEVKQLAYHLPRFVILCEEIPSLVSAIFLQFDAIDICKDLYVNGLISVSKENITEAALQSLNIISEMKYTRHYIKNVLGIEKINALREHLRFRNVESDFWYVTETIVESPLTNRGTEETQGEKTIRDTHSNNCIQDIPIDNRIGNIQLLKSLQGTLQEFTEELKNVRNLQENCMEIIKKDIREIKENNCRLEQKLHEINMKIKE